MIAVPGGSVWAQDTGGNGVPAVLLHPGWGDSAIWDAVVDLLGPAVRVIRYDSRGYRRSPAPTTPFTALGDLVAVLDALDVPRAVIVGHSGGGGTAATLAVLHPERVTSLVLLAPGFDGYPWPQDPYFEELSSLEQAGDVEGAVALGLRTWCRGGADAAALAQIRSAVAAFVAQAGFPVPDPDTFSRLAELTVPVHMLVGDLEYPMVKECVAAAAARMPGCQLTTLPGVDHLVPLRVPQHIASAIVAGLAASAPGMES